MAGERSLAAGTHTGGPPTIRRLPGEGPTDRMRPYLEMSYYLSKRGEPIINARLAAWLRVTPPTVTVMLQRMEERGYLARTAQHDLQLTELGMRQAEEIVRRLRLLECFLLDTVGIPWTEVYAEANRIEPVLSPMLEARVLALTTEATHCPHGNPIPGRAAMISNTVSLDQTVPGTSFVLRRISEEAESDEELLHYLASQALTPGAVFAVTQRAPSYGVAISRDQQRITLSPQLAGQLWGDVLA